MPTQAPVLAASKTGSLRTFAWAWLVYTLFIVILAVKVWIPSGLAARMDFRAMYAAGVLARTDPAHLYDFARQKQVEDALVANHVSLLPFGHLAHEALLFAPLSLLRYPAAYVGMILLNALLMGLCFLAARSEFSTIVPLWQPRAGWIFFSFFPTSIALALGQDSLLSLLMLCLTWKFLGRSRHFTAGMLLAVMLYKPHLAVLIALFLAVRFGWRFLAGFAAGSALVTALCIPFLRQGGWRSWLGILWGMSLAAHSKGADQASVGAYPLSMANLRGLLFTLCGGWTSPRVFLVILGAVSLAVLVWMLARVRRLSPSLAFALSLLAAVLLSYHFEPSDCVILLLPILLMQPVAGRVLAACKHAILALPIAVLLLEPSTSPGAGFALLAIPLLLAAGLLSWTTPSATWTARPVE